MSTIVASLALAAVALVVASFLEWTSLSTVLAVLLGAYMPSYLDSSEYTAKGRYWAGFAAAPIWRKLLPTDYKIIFDHELDPKSQYMFGSHPHGVGSYHHGYLLNNHGKGPGFNDVRPGNNRRSLGAGVVFKIPIFREYLLWSGVVDASKHVAREVLASGKDLVILVGGEAEQLLSQRGEHTVLIKKRKGFVRLALEYGIPIVPSYCFGETDLFTCSFMFFGARKWIQKRFGVCLPIGYGRLWWFPFLCHKDVKLVSVFGKPIEVPLRKKPSEAEVDEAHGKYIEELIRIFNKYKKIAGHGDKDIVIL